MTTQPQRFGSWITVAIPMLWLTVFLVIPFLIVLKISFSEAALARPPYLPIASWDEGSLLLSLNFESYQRLGTDTLYAAAFASSLRIAAVATFLTLLLGYPIAYYISRCARKWRNILLVLVILPLWTSFLLRVYAWIGFLKINGIFNQLLMAVGLIDQPLVILQTDLAVYVGIVYAYLPFMVLPLYATLVALDQRLLEASADLGAGSVETFFRITLPLSAPGIIAGCALVFIPSVGEFVIPELLGGPNTLMIGKVLWSEFFQSRDWPAAAAVASALLAILVLPILFLPRLRVAAATR